MNLCFQTNNNCGEFCLQTAKVWWRLNQSRDWQKCLKFFLKIFGIFGLEFFGDKIVSVFKLTIVEKVYLDSG